MTARDTIKSNLPFSSSPLRCAGRTLVSPIAEATSCATRTFFPVPSMSLKLASGKSIASGIPGNPPPVPKSNTLVPSRKFITLAIARE